MYHAEAAKYEREFAKDVILVCKRDYNLIIVSQGNGQHYNQQSQSHCSEKDR